MFQKRCVPTSNAVDGLRVLEVVPGKPAVTGEKLEPTSGLKIDGGAAAQMAETLLRSPRARKRGMVTSAMAARARAATAQVTCFRDGRRRVRPAAARAPWVLVTAAAASACAITDALAVMALAADLAAVVAAAWRQRAWVAKPLRRPVAMVVVLAALLVGVAVAPSLVRCTSA